MTNILLLGLTVSDIVVLSVADIVSFHYCGGNTNVGKIGLVMRGVSEHMGLGR